MSKHVRSNWETLLLVCRKCSKKLDGGFGPDGRTSLAKALRRELGATKGRKSPVGIIEVKCLGICPKHAVTMVDAAHPRDWLIVKAGTDVADVVTEIGGAAGAPD